jgi:peptidoglycan hydrolase-like protein with peptidoglycan-binding domain
VKTPTTLLAVTTGGGRPTLSLGAAGTAVRDLQARLKALRLLGGVDGSFGPKTRTAVMALQQARGLAADGVVGPSTWVALDAGGPVPSPSSTTTTAPPGPGAHPTLRLGATGPAGVDLQTRLRAAGFFTASVSGRFGPATRDAVLAFQKAKGLPVTGTVAALTWAALAGPSPSTPTTKPSTTTTAPQVLSSTWHAYGTSRYTTKKGDTVASVAKATGTTATALAAANRLASSTAALAVGTALDVPGPWQCPVPGASFVNDWGFPRAGHRHEGNDLFAPRGTPIAAPVAGTATQSPNRLGGNAVQLVGVDGVRYYFAHLDRYGAVGKVAAGAIIGYVGNSGDAITTVTHLHFEVHPGGGAPIDPYPTLLLACRKA